MLVTVMLAAGLGGMSGLHTAFAARGEAPFASDTGSLPPECRVSSITPIATGTRPDWSPDGALIGYDAPVGFTFELFVTEPSGAGTRCITCGPDVPPEIAGKHKGKFAFHPGGRHVVFGAENENGDHGMFTTPGFGDDHDLWVMSLGGGAYRRLTWSAKGSALQYPRFSSDGRKLLWSERYENGDPTVTGRELGLWRMKMADFDAPGGPTLANIVSLEPGGPGFYEPHGFSPDGRKIIFTAAINPAKSQFYGEIYTYDLVTGALTNLARADDLHFEQALAAPNGQKISFMSGPFIGPFRFGYKTDLYLMDADGSNRARLTHFNESGYPESTGTDTLIDKNAWSPDGRALVMGVYLRERNEMTVRVLRFAGACGFLSPYSVHAAVLPSSRSGWIGRTVTAFATILNPRSTAATGCGIYPITIVPAAFAYQTTDPSTNAPTGTPNTPAAIAGGAGQTYVVAFTPTERFPPTEVRLAFKCADGDPAAVIPGVNTLLLSGTQGASPDIVALAATTTNDGITHLAAGGSWVGAFAVAAVNLGPGEAVRVSADTGGASLPIALAICQSAAVTAECLSAAGPSVDVTIDANATPTFAVFIGAAGPIPLDPAVNRVFVRFRDGSGVTRGSTSVAVWTR